MNKVWKRLRSLPVIVVFVLAASATLAASYDPVRTASRQLVETAGITKPTTNRQLGSPTDIPTADVPVALAVTGDDGVEIRPSVDVERSEKLSGAVAAERALPSATTSAPQVDATSNAPSTAPSTAPTTAAPAVAAAGIEREQPAAPSRTPSTAAPAAPATTAAPVTAAPTTAAPATTAAPVTAAPTTAAPATTAAPSAPPVPSSGNAGHNGNVGCRGECPQVGFQNLDGQNGVVLENVTISNPNGRCLSLVNAQNITIRNVTITNCGTASPVWDHYDAGLVNIVNSSNITIENSRITNMSARHHSSARNNAIQVKNSNHVRIVNNEFRDIHSDINQRENDVGNRAISVQYSSHNIVVEHNHFANAGRNAIQVKEVRNAGGMRFSYNIVEGRGPWDSDYEDMVNLYSSSGRSDDPFVIRGNYLRNGGPSPNGTAIIVGDGNASKGSTQFVLVESNVIVDPGNVGINLAGGDNITVRNNVIYGTANVRYFESVGFIINHFYYSQACYSHTVSGNRVWMRNQHHGSGVNHLWNSNTCDVNMYDNIFGDGSLSASVWNP